MKKFLSLLMAVLMMASVLAGCGGDTTTDETEQDANTQDTTTEQTGTNVSPLTAPAQN